LTAPIIVATITKVKIDPGKDLANRLKHGISLAAMEQFDFTTAIVTPDKRYDYGENRFSALGFIDDRLYVLIFTLRNGARRPISLRKANERERNRYVLQKTA